jgi:hypothetical protein
MIVSSRPKLALAAGLFAALVLAGVLLLSGGAEGGSGDLAWSGTPHLYQSGKPTDRVLYGRMQNTSIRSIALDVDTVKVVDADGHAVRSSVVFLQAFAHSLFAWSQRPAKLTKFERRRLGQIATVRPGKTLPVTVSWRVPPGGKPPVRVDFGTSSIALPDTVATPADT